MEDVCVTKNIITRTNQKPWMISKVRGLQKAHVSILRSARANLNCAIRVAKTDPQQERAGVCPWPHKHMADVVGNPVHHGFQSGTATTSGQNGLPERYTYTILIYILHSLNHWITLDRGSLLPPWWEGPQAWGSQRPVDSKEGQHPKSGGPWQNSWMVT